MVFRSYTYSMNRSNPAPLISCFTISQVFWIILTSSADRLRSFVDGVRDFVLREDIFFKEFKKKIYDEGQLKNLEKNQKKFLRS